VALIAFASVRSCGVTTLATGLAMAWPAERPRLLVEADPAGGVLAATAGLGPEPGLVSLAAAARRLGEPSLAFEHTQLLPGGIPVVCGPPSASRARSALSMISGLLGRLGELDADVFFDCGRLDLSTANVEIFERADLAVLACRPHLSDLNGLAAFLDERQEGTSRPVLVLVGDGPYHAEEITEVLGLDVAAQLPWDPDAAAAFGTAPLSSRHLTRAPLARAMRSLAAELAGRLASAPVGPEGDADGQAMPASDSGKSVAEVPS
jgi:MinD-like ATPase involved in chromosome partitioning or flagellar assembly